jgi:hypothetical protein
MTKIEGAIVKTIGHENRLWVLADDHLKALEFAREAAKVVEREKVAKWMVERSYATGHGDTIEDLLAELDWQIADGWNRALINGVKTEREACAKVAEKHADIHRKNKQFVYAAADDKCAYAIRARGQG